MSRKIYPYSLDRKDAKVAGVASTIGAMTGIDPTFIRIGFVAAAIFISFKLTLIAYAAIGIYLAVQKKRSMTTDRRMSDFDRMGQAVDRRPTTQEGGPGAGDQAHDIRACFRRGRKSGPLRPRSPVPAREADIDGFPQRSCAPGTP